MQFHGFRYNFPSVELWLSAEAGFNEEFIDKKAEGSIELVDLVYENGRATHLNKFSTRVLSLNHSSRSRALGLAKIEGFLVPVGIMKVPIYIFSLLKVVSNV